MRMFKTCRDDDMPPHIYAVAQSTLNNLLRTRRDQSVVLQGRSGSGKTTSFRHLLQYLVAVAGSAKQILTGSQFFLYIFCVCVCFLENKLNSEFYWEFYCNFYKILFL